MYKIDTQKTAYLEFPVVAWDTKDPGTVQDAIQSYAELTSDIQTWLSTFGAVLFRGYGVVTTELFHQFAESTSGGFWGYRNGNSPRSSLGKGIYTASEYPPEFAISLHNELSYSDAWPPRLYFNAALPALEGGVACVADSRAIYRNMPDAILKEFEQRGGVQYFRVLESRKGLGATWQDTFETEVFEEVSDFCAANGIVVSHLPGERIKLANTRPAHIVSKHGSEVWFNQADQFHPSGLPREIYEALMFIAKGKENEMPQSACFGNGDPFSDDFLDAVRDNINSQRVTFPWQRGDVLILDNELIAHGRMPYRGKRELYVALTT